MIIRMKLFALSVLLVSVACSTATCKVWSARARGAAGGLGSEAAALGTTLNGKVQAVNVVYDDWFDSSRDRSVPVKLYFPAGGGASSYPVIVFSHGLGGSRDGAQYLGEYWSTHGYICVFVQHVGSDTSVWQPIRDQSREVFMERMQSAINASTFSNRVGDIKFVLDEIERRNSAKGPLQGKFDVSRIAIAGHSYGANTSLTMVGQKYFLGPYGKDFADPRIKAAIYLSPPANLQGKTPQQVFGGITVPGLLMTGTEDNSPIGSTRAEDRRLPFEGMMAPHQYLVTFTGGDHMIFNGATRRAEKPGDKQMLTEIERVTTAFLDAYLRGDDSQQKWLDTDASAFMSSDAKFERK